jgi:hypothetical protein
VQEKQDVEMSYLRQVLFYADDVTLLGKNVGSKYFKNKEQTFSQTVKRLV